MLKNAKNGKMKRKIFTALSRGADKDNPREAKCPECSASGGIKGG